MFGAVLPYLGIIYTYMNLLNLLNGHHYSHSKLHVLWLQMWLVLTVGLCMSFVDLV